MNDLDYDRTILAADGMELDPKCHEAFAPSGVTRLDRDDIAPNQGIPPTS